MPDKSQPLDLQILTIDAEILDDLMNIGSNFIPAGRQFVGTYCLSDYERELPLVLRELEGLQEKHEGSGFRFYLQVNGYLTETPLRDPKLYDEILALAKREPKKKPLTVKALLDSGFIGFWRNRADIVDSENFASQLRKSAEKRCLE